MATRRNQKIVILCDTWEDTSEEPGPPPAPEEWLKRGGRKPRRRPKLDREQIADALEKLGYETAYHVLDGQASSLASLARASADLVFNLVESYAGDDTKDMHVAAYLDLIGKRYTGSGPHALYLAQDKGLAKKIFQFHDIPTPFSAVSYRGRVEHAADIAFPVIVKPTSEDGSLGIDAGSVVTSIKELMERIQYIEEKFDSPALIEEYIEGREVYAAVLGTDKPEVLPLVELDLSRLPEGMPRLAGAEVKWQRETEAYRKTKSAAVEDLDEPLVTKLQETARAAYQALKLRDYGRVDMRLTDDGHVYVIEANPNPWLSSEAEFAIAARKSGRTYTQMVSEIVEMALGR